MADGKKTDATPEEAKTEETESGKPAANKAAPKTKAAKTEEPAEEYAKAEEAPAAEIRADDKPAEGAVPRAEAVAEKTDVPAPLVKERRLSNENNVKAVTRAAENTTAASRPPRGGRGGNNRGRGRGRDNRRDDDGEDLVEKLVHINRVSKTVKGGKRFGFAALMIVGDGNGRAGFGHGKAREVPEAIQKATAAAKKNMMRVPLRDGRTLHHDGQGRFGAGNVTVRSAPPGTGIIAGGPMRAVFESLGVADVVTKSVGTSNPYNMIRATFEALKDQSSPKSVAARRGLKIAELVRRRGDIGTEEARAEAEAVTE